MHYFNIKYSEKKAAPYNKRHTASSDRCIATIFTNRESNKKRSVRLVFLTPDFSDR